VRLLGFCIYVAAFFLPAIREVATPGAGEPGIHEGWFCAWVTLVNTFSSQMWHSKDCLAILSGWINPLVLLYLVFLIWRKAVWPRRMVAGLVVAFMIGTWIYFYLVPLVPLIGHFLWIAGILMMLAGEVVGCESVAVENSKA
jgi:uncharacterized membrane protein YraQ (UPF0718 family)